MVRLVGVAIALLAAGCGAGGPRPPVTITVTGFNFARGAQLQEDTLDGFTRDTGIRVVLIPTWGTSSQQYEQASRLLERRSPTPDVLLLDLVWIGALAEHLLDLSAHGGAEDDLHLPQLLAGDRSGPRLVALPFYASVGTLHYRRDLLARYGYRRPPATWDELEAMARRIQEGERRRGQRDFWGYVFQGAAYEGLTCNALEWQVAHGGGAIIDPPGRVTVRNEGAARALDRARRWVGTIAPPGVLFYREDDAAGAFASGRAAFLRSWNAPAASGPESPIREQEGFAPLPAGPGGQAAVLGGFHLAVSRYSAHPREAAHLVALLTGREVQKQRALLRGVLPTRPAVLEDADVAGALVQARVLAASRGVLRPSALAGTRYGEVSRAFYEAVHAVLAGERPARGALAELEERLVAATGLPAGPPAGGR